MVDGGRGKDPREGCSDWTPITRLTSRARCIQAAELWERSVPTYRAHYGTPAVLVVGQRDGPSSDETTTAEQLQHSGAHCHRLGGRRCGRNSPFPHTRFVSSYFLIFHLPPSRSARLPGPLQSLDHECYSTPHKTQLSRSHRRKRSSWIEESAKMHER